ncbi:alanine racemase [Sinorhizobium medicae]|uniref:alanine racemase n=1 Tax=Sinorhizobium medicae TaxID=110321 RepID=UPI0011A90AAF|nr:alanine racemase [Sinorhizobium medicae]MDX0465179.1 alanine racemase [Sinorhizobium medicae]MDX0657564.1 alanine racemase [Sinorhizobium medicae]MDX1172291.1 alanine racemase [Sinorhizobium medicae]MDX1197618.1 alanine racemase [Sinorhizobium medicae]MDX1223348.1 alanine racemase [Sinorhizobium medicae]
MQNSDFSSASSRLTVDLAALADNWRMMNERSGRARAAAVLKGNAYGLGVMQAAPALYAAGARDFFVASVEEGAELRPLVPEGRVYVLAGMWPGNEALFFENDLVPIINSQEQLAYFMAALSERGDHPCVLHVDTGMNRLGLSPEEALRLVHDPVRPASFSPVLVMSHLACADDPGHPMNRHQLQRFREVTAFFEGVPASLANSGGVFLGEDYHFDLTRPGIAVYGGEAVDGDVNPMEPVVIAEARIVQIRTVPSGESASYGASVRFGRDSRIATVAIGYADGYHRSVSGGGVTLRQAMPSGAFGFLHGRKVPHVGRVTMDLSLFDVTDLPESTVRAGDYIELFGRNIPIDDVARAGGTIGYELLTSLGRRYHRTYVGGA